MAVRSTAVSARPQEPRVQAGLIVVPHVPSPEDRLEPPLLHGAEQNLVHPVAKRGVIGRRMPT